MAEIKVKANTSELRRSLLETSRDIKDLGRTKVSIFSEQDKRFLRRELNSEISKLKQNLVSNRAEVAKMVAEQKKLVKGSKEEAEQRKKILDAYKEQIRMGKDLNRLQEQRGGIGRMGAAGGGGLSGIVGLLGRGMAAVGSMMGLGAVGAMAYGGLKTLQSGGQFAATARDRVRLAGLGGETNRLDPRMLAEAGLTEPELIQRQIRAVGTLGRAGGARESLLEQARFERAFGLEEGAMLNVSTSLRAGFGGRGADEAQRRLQASIMAAGIEDALGPYLDVATDLLANINENGLTQTDEITNLFAQLARDNARTPEQISAAIQGIDAAIRGSGGEANAFLQQAFGRAGIGGGTIGGARLALSSGGLFGLNEQELRDRGYNLELLRNMRQQGITGTGVQDRGAAVLNQFRDAAGLGQGQRIGDVTDVNTMVGLSNLANSIFGTQGLGGFDALQLLEEAQTTGMDQRQFQERLDELKAEKDPQVERLTKINDTLAGQTTVLEAIRDNQMQALGEEIGANIRNIGTEGEIGAVQGARTLTGATGAGELTRRGRELAGRAREETFTGGIGERLYNWWHGDDKDQTDVAEGERRQRERMRRNALPYQQTQRQGDPTEEMATAVERGMTRAMNTQRRNQPPAPNIMNKISNKIINSDGSVRKTHR